MIIVMRPGATAQELKHLVARIKKLGLKPWVSKGVERTIVGVIGEEEAIRTQPLEVFPGVEKVLSILKPYKIASRDFKKDYGVKAPVWGYAAHPLLAGKNLICLVGGEPTVVAFDAASGREVWRAFKTKEPGYSPPVLTEANGKHQLIIWQPEAVSGLNPETGQVYWSVPFKVRDGLCVATPRQAGGQLFVTAFYDGSLMLRLGAAEPEVLWRSKKDSERDTDYLHAIMCTPFAEGGCIYGVCSYGQLRCLRADTGERLWETLAATTNGKETRWANAFIVKHEDRFFLFNEKGDLIIAKLTPQGYQELSRAHLLEPVNRDPGRAVVWSHPTGQGLLQGCTLLAQATLGKLGHG